MEFLFKNFLLLLTISYHILPMQKELVLSLENDETLNEMRYEAVEFSKNKPLFSQEFCNHVLDCAPQGIKKEITLLSHENIAQRLSPTKMILHGSPGTGKLTLAEAVCQKIKINYLILKAHYFHAYSPQQQRNEINHVLDQARSDKKLAVIIQHIDMLEDECYPAYAIKFLLDLFDTNRNLFFATCTKPYKIPSYFKHRFCGCLELVSNPSNETRKKIIVYLLQKASSDLDETTLNLFSENISSNLSISDLQGIIKNSYNLAFTRNNTKPQICIEDLKTSSQLYSQSNRFLCQLL